MELIPFCIGLKIPVANALTGDSTPPAKTLIPINKKHTPAKMNR